MKIGEVYQFISTQPDVDSFKFKIFGIRKNSHNTVVDVIVNDRIYSVINSLELLKSNVKRISSGKV